MHRMHVNQTYDQGKQQFLYQGIEFLLYQKETTHTHGSNIKLFKNDVHTVQLFNFQKEHKRFISLKPFSLLLYYTSFAGVKVLLKKSGYKPHVGQIVKSHNVLSFYAHLPDKLLRL